MNIKLVKYKVRTALVGKIILCKLHFFSVVYLHLALPESQSCPHAIGHNDYLQQIAFIHF